MWRRQNTGNTPTLQKMVKAAITTTVRIKTLKYIPKSDLNALCAVHSLLASSRLALTNQISSSGPTRKEAPRSFAMRMLSRMRCRFPSKSRAHWLSEQVATVIKCPMVRGNALQRILWLGHCRFSILARDYRPRVDVIHATNKENHNTSREAIVTPSSNSFKQLSNMATTKVQKIMVQPIVHSYYIFFGAFLFNPKRLFY